MNESPNKLSRQSPEDRGVKRRTAERRVSVRSLFGDENIDLGQRKPICSLDHKLVVREERPSR